MKGEEEDGGLQLGYAEGYKKKSKKGEELRGQKE